MKLVYVTSGMGLHVKAISDSFYNLLGTNFCFISVTRPNKNAKSIHQHAEIGNKYDETYIFNSWESADTLQIAYKLINQADVVIFGGIPYHYVSDRIKNHKLTFISSERLFKRPFYMTSPKGWYNIYKSIVSPQNNRYFYLALSAYCANDLALIHSFKNRIFKFGYLVPVEKYNIEECLVYKRRNIIEILWCARFIDWKHPELVTELALMLVKNGIDNFHINMVGAASSLQVSIKEWIVKNHLSNYITIISGLPNSKIRSMMKLSNIFLITSDRKEGWGAVLNEAMAAGCGIIASNQIGSAPFLLKHMRNGLIFKSRDINSLYGNVLNLIKDHALREKLAKNAYFTISEEWSADNVAKRFISIAESILNDNMITYEDGPCSLSFPCDENALLIE